MAKIRYIKDKDGSIVFPVTHERAVKDSNGVLLADKISQLASLAELDAKQDVLVSGSNIKTINGVPVIGRGNIRIREGADEVVVTVDPLPSAPRAVGEMHDGVLTLTFYGLKGATGDPGTTNARQVVVTELPEASSETADTVYMVKIGDTDEYERYITQSDGENYSWLMIGTTEMTLDDYIKKEDIIFCTEEELEEIEVFDPNKFYVTYEDEAI